MTTAVRWLVLALAVSAGGAAGVRALDSVNAQGSTAASKQATAKQAPRQQGTPAAKPPARNPAQDQDPNKPDMNVFLIGDAGAPAPGNEPVLKALTKALSEDPSHSVAVFLGDNIYPDGLPLPDAPGRKESERRLDAQLDAIKASKARGIMIAGNHDWGGISGRDGFRTVIRQGAYVAEKGVGVSYAPQAGCPGPAVEDVGTVLRLVMLDTQWWLRRSAPPKEMKDEVPCAFVSQKDVLDSLKTIMKGSEGRRVLVMSHHPLASMGSHGGYFNSKSQMFPLTSLKSWLRVPLPMVGSVYVAARRMGMSEQDLSSSEYARMIQGLMSTFTKDEPLAFAAGHEHSLQVMNFQDAPRFLLVSGTGIYGHVSAVGRSKPTKYAASQSGFMRIRAWPDGRIRLTVITVDGDAKMTEAYDQWMVETPPVKKTEAKNAD